MNKHDEIQDLRRWEEIEYNAITEKYKHLPPMGSPAQLERQLLNREFVRKLKEINAKYPTEELVTV